MQNTLSTNSLNSLILSWSQYRQAVYNCADSEGVKNVTGLKGSLTGFFIKDYIDRIKADNRQKEYEGHRLSHIQDFVIIAPGQKEADECETDLLTILGDDALIHKLPWWDNIPYRPASSGSKVFGERASVLSKLCIRQEAGQKPRIFIITQRSVLSPVPSPSYIKNLVFKLKKGQTIEPENLSKKLTEEGYIRVPKVGMPGEYTLRGEVLDIFIPGEKLPYRIVFDFDTIEQIKTFDNETQTTKEKVESVIVCPMKEVVWTEELCTVLDQKLSKMDTEGIKNDFASYDAGKKNGMLPNVRNLPTEHSLAESLETDNAQAQDDKFNDQNQPGDQPGQFLENNNITLSFTEKAKNQKETLLLELLEKGESSGEELFYGCLWDKMYSILDYLPKDASVFFLEYDRLLNGQKLLENEYTVSYRTARLEFPVLPPKEMLLDFNYVLKENQHKTVNFRSLETLETLDKNKENVIQIQCENSQSYFGNINYLKEQLTEFQNTGWNIYIFADNGNQALRINEILKEYTENVPKNLKPVHIIPEAITEGFTVTDEKILVIQENAIFGRKKNTPKSIRTAKSKAIDTFVELTPGDYIVHVNYGIGIFKGIERVKSMGTERDYIKLEYADEEFAFVPIEQVNMVQRYIGNENLPPKIDRIGSKSWNSRKAKVQKKVEEIAEKLIDLYSKRKASRGFAFPKDTEWNSAFEAAFPYEDTPDQFQATQDIKNDMEKPVPMDRLICGDVGYGKTEIAMRAAFKAVMGGKQVAFLAPTTILAEQHYENCLERFKNFPVTIAQMSRFVSPSEQKKILEKLSKGEIDILIGTHRIIQKDVQFKNLGLMIIDEEQRFGVTDKEKLKELKTNIDCLSMSATPIPRTLHMSLLKIRDMSLLTTPPQNRLPIETVIEEYDEEKIARAIRNEVSRGGQVFYLHNRVETLEDTRHRLENLCPEMIIDIAHGQMTSEQLDDIFRRFKMGGFNVLVATTIIENGIDIPNVNTIIIDRADMYGVSQLYQLRGRVGRSDRKAYAYLFYPENKVLSEVAMKRLKVISDFTELGSGFKIAMKDMEIRGAGNLLGKDQSGEVYAVGFEMYLNLLNAAIERLQNSSWEAPQEVLLELEYSGYIPDNYITDAETKMEMYKKIAAVKTQDELNSVWEELYDRFGPIPDEVSSLLSLAKIRIICTKLSIISLKEKKGIVYVEFGEVHKISIEKLLRLVSSSGGKVKLDAQKPNFITMQIGTIDLTAKSEFIKQNLEQLIS